MEGFLFVPKTTPIIKKEANKKHPSPKDYPLRIINVFNLTIS